MAIEFNTQFYLQSKFNQLEAEGLLEEFGLTDVDSLAVYFLENNVNAQEHYLNSGMAEGINPSADFDTSAYLEAKLGELKNADKYGDTYADYTVEDVIDAFKKANLTPLQHFNTYGESEGLTAAPAEEEVTSELTEGLAAYETAEQLVDTEQTEFSAALFAAQEAGVRDFGVTYDEAEDTYAGFSADRDYVTQAEGAVLAAKTTLNDARQINTDAQLQAAVTKAQTVVNDADVRFDAAGNEMVEVFKVTDVGTATAGGISNGAYVTAEYADLEGVASSTSVGHIDVATPSTATNGLELSADEVVTVDDTAAAGLTVEGELVSTIYTAAQLQARAANAEAKYDANVEANGDSADLAAELKDAVSLYLNENADIGSTAFDTLQTAIGTYESAIVSAAGDEDALIEAESTFLTAVETANDAVFSGEDDASILESGARGDSVEALLTTLNTRNDLLVDWVGENLTAATPAGKQGAFEASEAVVFTTGTTLTAAQDAQEVREGEIQAVADAEAAFEAISAASGEYESAVDAATTAQEELGFAVTSIETDSVLASDEADLFIFNAETAEEDGLGSEIFINGMESDDVLFLFGDYQQAEGEGNNNELEFFLTETDGNAVLQIENSAFGSNDGTDGDFTTITLTGVAQNDVSIEGSVVSIA